MQQTLGARDKARLGDYLDNVREIERRIERAEARHSVEVTAVALPAGVPDVFEEHLALMYDLLTLAYQADLTRVFTFMSDRELSQRTYPQIGVSEQHHTVSHHGNDAGEHREGREDQHVSRRAVREVSRQAARDARRRRLALRPLADLLRRRNGQSEPARQRSAAAPRRRRRRRQGPSPHPAAAADADRQPVGVGGERSTATTSPRSARATARWTSSYEGDGPPLCSSPWRASPA